MTSRPETRSQWEGEVWAKPIEAVHLFAGATLALIPAAPRAAKSLNADGGGGPNGRLRANRSQSPRCPCKAPPKSYHPMVRLHRRGTAPDSICRFGGRLVQNAIGRIATLASAPLTK